MTPDLAAYAAGSTEPWTVSVLQALIRLTRPRRILELGTFEGLTTTVLHETLPEAEIVTVDLQKRWETLPEGVTFVRSEALKFLRSCDEWFDFVFVDDNHQPGHVAEEVDLLTSGIVFDGGLIVLHDVIGPFGLDKIVRERGGFIIDLPLLHAAGGLGVIEV